MHTLHSTTIVSQLRETQQREHFPEHEVQASAARGSISGSTGASVGKDGTVADLVITVATSGHCHFACRAALIWAHKSFLQDFDLLMD